MHIENMSVSAYRVNTLEYASQPTFNCSYEAELFDYLLNDVRVFDGRNNDGVGIIEVSLELLSEALDHDGLQISGNTRASIEADMAWAREKGRDYIQYDCF